MRPPEIASSPSWSLRPIRLELWTLLAIALLGVTRIPEPFSGLQALFMMMARSLHRGATLYVDVWDTKQPGIFLFYDLAGRLFGYTEIGAHLLELIYQLVTAGVLIWLVRRELRQPILAALAGFLAVGSFYLGAVSRHLGQIEGLVGLPILVNLALASQSAASPAGRRARMFGAGVAAGVVALFKLILSPIPALAWVVAYLVHRAEEGTSATSFFRDWLFPAVAGTGVVLGGTVLWAGLHHGLSALLWASFMYPIMASAEIARAPWDRLRDSILWFLTSHWIVILLGACGWVGWRGRRKEIVVIQAWAWLLMGVGVILAQKLSYWSYHFELLVPPIAILAARGCDGMLDRLGWLRVRPRTVVAAVMAITVLAGCRQTLRRLSTAIEVAALPSPVTAYRDQLDPPHRLLRADVAFLDRPSAVPGPIYVFGNPLVLWLGHREQAGAIQGWSWSLFPQQLWDRLPRQIETSRPVYVLVEPEYVDLLQRRSPATVALLQKDYRQLDTSGRGTWYQLAVPASPPPGPGSSKGMASHAGRTPGRPS